MNNIHNKSLSFFKLVRITSTDNKSFIEFQGRFAAVLQAFSTTRAGISPRSFLWNSRKAYFFVFPQASDRVRPESREQRTESREHIIFEI
jgi:hypothetical protein